MAISRDTWKMLKDTNVTLMKYENIDSNLHLNISNLFGAKIK